MSVVLSFFCYQSLQFGKVALDGGVPKVLFAAQEPLVVHFSQLAFEGCVIAGHVHFTHDETLECPMEGESGRMQYDVLQVQHVVNLTVQEVSIVEGLLEMSSEEGLHLQRRGLVLVSEEQVECLHGELLDVFRTVGGTLPALSCPLWVRSGRRRRFGITSININFSGLT